MEDFYQYSVFDIFSEPLKIDKPIRLIELFAGIGSQAKALERIGADFEHYRVCEFDKYAIKSYNAIHGTSFETSDITQITADDLGIVDTDKYTYLLTYSFPCQDLSLAGKQKGMAKGENTRSGLLWEVERLLNECEELPQILLMENVTQVHGKKNMEHFQEWIEFLESKGYSNYWKDLNAKNFGIPQNRNRTFMVSVLGNYTYEFPKEFLLELRLKDMLEDSVEEKFYLSEKMINFFTENTKKQQAKGNGFRFAPTDGNVCAKAVTTRAGGRMDDNFIEEPKCEQVGMLSGGKWDKMHDISRRVYSGDGVAPTIHTSGGGQQEPKVAEPFIVASRGRNPDNPSDRTPGIYLEQRLEPNFSGCSNTLTTVQKDNYVAEPLAYDEQNGYIRKDGTVGTLTTDGSSPKHNNRVVEPLVWDGYNQRIRAEQGTVGTLTTNCGADLKRNGQGIIEISGSVEKTEQLLSDVKDGRYPQDTAYGKYLFQSSRFDDKPLEECSQTIKSTKVDCGVIHNFRIRKLTPKECWRLMGFDDADFEKAAQYNSNSQLYKQAGNSIVVDVLAHIFTQML